jgi:hypothetical protein
MPSPGPEDRTARAATDLDPSVTPPQGSPVVFGGTDEPRGQATPEWEPAELEAQPAVVRKRWSRGVAPGGVALIAAMWLAWCGFEREHERREQEAAVKAEEERRDLEAFKAAKVQLEQAARAAGEANVRARAAQEALAVAREAEREAAQRRLETLRH